MLHVAEALVARMPGAKDGLPTDRTLPQARLAAVPSVWMMRLSTLSSVAKDPVEIIPMICGSLTVA